MRGDVVTITDHEAQQLARRRARARRLIARQQAVLRDELHELDDATASVSPFSRALHLAAAESARIEAEEIDRLLEAI